MLSDADTALWSREAKDLYAYWRGLAPDGGLLPGRQHFDPLDVPALLPYLWMIDVAADPRDNKYRLFGTYVTAGFGRDHTGLTLREAHPASAEDPLAFRFMSQVASRRAPHWYRGKPRFDHDKDVAELENLILPLAADGRVVDVLLGLTVFYRNNGERF